MKLTTKLALTISLVFISGCANAEAADFNKIMESFTGTTTGWQEFDKQKVELSTAIDSALASGQLSKAQADDFKQQLETLNQQEAQAKSSGKFMSFVQSISFNKQFNALTQQVAIAIEQGKTTTPDAVKLQSDLRTRIENDLKAGKLSEADATSIKADLAHVASMETAYRAESHGLLSQRQTELLLVELNKVKARLDQEEELADSGSRTLVFRRQSLETKISEGLAQARMSPTDASVLQQELAKIAMQQKQFQTANRILTGGQVLQIAGDLDRLSQQIDSKLLPPKEGAQPTPVASNDNYPFYFSRFDHRISRLYSMGRISQKDADDLRHDLDRTADLYQAYKTANPVLNATQTSKIDSELDTLSKRLDEFRPTNIASNTPPTGSQPTGFPGTGPGTASGQPLVGDGRFADGGRRHGFRRGGAPQNAADNAPAQNQVANTGTPNEKLPVQVTTKNPELSFPVIAEKTFTDINGYWAQQYITQLANRGIIGGFPNGTFRPEAKITRAQFAAIAASALKLPKTEASNNFTDVPAKYWAAPAIAAASNAGLIGGFPDGSFKPEESLTRAQALVILSKALKSPQDNPAALEAYTDAKAVPSWAANSVAQAANAHIIVNFPEANQIKPNALTVRGEVAGLMYQTLSALGADLPRISTGVLESSTKTAAD